jgi:DEAD/DEAH box helicase domain-containing protein
MLPTVVSREMEEGIKSFLKTTFPPATPAFEHSLANFLDEPGRVFKGPYYQLRLPFRPAPAGRLPFERVTFPNRPYLHQAQAFDRLSGDVPESTLIATGTGSGKTECFLYPILDDCALRAGTPGIKAILIYPMNALATDQARRLAREIFASDALRGKVTAGLYIGGEIENASVEMTPDELITHKGHLREHPPDILLTNYKMLDYLLLRPSEQDLWRQNAPATLRFLVVDELHTFDGAQSTDLACLIRRLKARLRMPAKHLCCVGTSATLGGTDAGPLLEYAETVFAEPFGEASILGEHLLGLADITDGLLIKHHSVPDPDDERLQPAHHGGDAQTYLLEQFRLWFDVAPPDDFDQVKGRIALGVLLREHSFFRNLLMLTERSGKKALAEEWLVHEAGRLLRKSADASGVVRVLDSFLALCAHARYEDPVSESVSPLLRVHLHLWVRELSRLVASVEKTPAMAFSDDLKGDVAQTYLPALHCRECGAMGWGGTMRSNDEKVSANLQEFYRAFFQRKPTLRFFFPMHDRQGNSPEQGEFTHQLCGHCLAVNRADAPQCAHCSRPDQLIAVLVHDRTRRIRDQVESDISCPCCGSASGVTIMGSRAASITSVALSQLYTSSFNQDKQALAFSDNVQDASHRAGFFAARTYRVNLRTAIYEVLSESDPPLTLTQLEARFLAYWKEKLGDTDFTGLFLAPNMEWLDDYQTLKNEGRLPPGADLTHWVERRSGWELTAEFGFNARIGRTLEKSGTAMAYIHPDQVRACTDAVIRELKEQAGGFGAVREEEVRFVLQGLLQRLRTSGGVYHNELRAFIESGGNTYLLNRTHHMPSFGQYARAPAFPYMGTTIFRRFERLIAGGTATSWAQQWTMKLLKSVPNIGAESAAWVVESAYRALTRAGVLRELSVQGNRLWVLAPEALLITQHVHLLSCSHCGHAHSCAELEAALWEGSPCLRTACQGQYTPQPPSEDYFGSLYRSGDVIRIRTEEHTGMLDRAKREWIESRFMARDPDRRITDPNLLSSTPTLEMGVNIGDLSSVILCTVPPATANYVQRVGRAGRREGVAVSLTIAAAQPHDLYYFELPEDMLAGDIQPPGTYLNAPKVLERQFTAYCFDRWSEQSNPEPVLPHKLDPVLDAVRNPDPASSFPFDFFAFVEARLVALIEGFLSLFSATELTDDSREALISFARGASHDGNSLSHTILTRLRGLAEDREDLRSQAQKVGRAIQKNRRITNRDDALDEELATLLQHRNGITEMQNQINRKVTLNFFTDEGLLPNYAFPEEGVELRSVILKKRQQAAEGEARFRAESFEYMRPASAAITELAPNNTFYVEGRRLKVDQVGLGVSPIESWHFCDACGYMERVVGNSAQTGQCPACSSPNWSDSSLRRDMIRLRQVISTSFDERSRSHDEKDQRDAEFYNRHESIVIPPDAVRTAYQVSGSSTPFGFEFLGKLTLRVVNLGQDTPSAQAFRLGGREIASQGFLLCPECGKVQPKGTGEQEPELKHDISCRYRGRDPATLKAVFLYRELHSEAIRILLPSSGDENGDMVSFIAALQLGLRLHFKGNIEHLRGCVDERPVPNTSMRRKYLVLYDQVPGGTGYLKQLSRSPQDFMQVLHLALRHLRDCSCATRQDHDMDGCHRCILQGQHRGFRAGLSRTAAIRLLEAILAHEAELKQVERITDIDIHPLIRSELEKQFMASLGEVPGADLRPQIVRKIPGYLWRCGEAAWEIAPQVSIRAGHGIDTASIPDFVFYPVRPQTGRPIAIFLDGFAFHADEAAGNNRIAKDVLQRQALVHSGQFWTWSFSWEDVQYRHDPTKISATRFGYSSRDRYNALSRELFSGEELSRAEDAHRVNAWTLFLEFLNHSEATFWERLAYLEAVSLPERLHPANLDAAREVVKHIGANTGNDTLTLDGDNPQGVGAVVQEHNAQLAGAILLTLDAVRKRDAAGTFSLMRFDDDSRSKEPEFAHHWRGLLHLMNRLQFLPHSHFITTRGCQQGLYSGLQEAYEAFLGGPGSPTASSTCGKTAANSHPDLDYAADGVLPLLERIGGANSVWPEIGYEHEEDGIIVASAELAWPEQRIAVVNKEMIEDQHVFKSLSWDVYTFTESGMEADALETLLSKIPERP